MPKKRSGDISVGATGAVYTVDGLAAELGISRQSVYAGLRQGKIPSIRLGKRFIISRTAIDDWLRESGKHENRQDIENSCSPVSGRFE